MKKWEEIEKIIMFGELKDIREFLATGFHDIPHTGSFEKMTKRLEIEIGMVEAMKADLRLLKSIVRSCDKMLRSIDPDEFSDIDELIRIQGMMHIVLNQGQRP